MPTEDVSEADRPTEGFPTEEEPTEDRTTNHQSTEDLLDRWETVLPGQRVMAQDLLTRYAEPHRRYHTVAHLRYVLDRIDDFAGRDHDLFLVRLAAWFHDAVYAIPEGQISNEEASARLAFRELGRAGLEQEDLNEVARLVRMTSTHQPPPGDRNGALLCDADLAILGASPVAYQRYAAAIREEFAQVDDETFWSGRLEILGPLAESDIFRTGKGRKLIEQAHANLLDECESLQASLEALNATRVQP